LPSTDLVRPEPGGKAIGGDDGGPPLAGTAAGKNAMRLEGSELRDAIIENLE